MRRTFQGCGQVLKLGYPQKVSTVLLAVREFTCLDLKFHILFRNEDKDSVKVSRQAAVNSCFVLPGLAQELWSQMSSGVSLTLQSLESLLTFPVYPHWNIKVFPQDI